ncbi:MmcQ/YjbR family DNA-binding protein [Desulfitobacterium chlororespirans]|nr:MmcQ/YjbR family DNA-binding protein [Desulfitobacterium chlororespirans]
MTVTITLEGAVSTEIIDPAFGEPYILHLADGVSGSFVGEVKSQYEETLRDIVDKCFEPNVFKSVYAKKLIEYVRNTYGDELEFLWQRSPENAIWRRKDTGKWYSALLTVSKRKLGIGSDEVVEIIDLRIKPEELEALIDNKKYYPGYHMNKKHWCTIILDVPVPVEEICRRIDESYLLAVK